MLHLNELKYSILYYSNVIVIFYLLFLTDLETGALEEKNKRDHYTQLVGACLVGRDTLTPSLSEVYHSCMD